MKKLIIAVVALVASVCSLQARDSGNFYIDSFVQTLVSQGSDVDYDGKDVVMTITDKDRNTEAAMASAGSEAMGQMIKEQSMKSFSDFDDATRQLLRELAKAGSGLKVRYVCGSQSAEAYISPQELLGI
ncbi:MAG: hypothetical protein K2L80_02530 [Muribaculaceae bacterium]|nr:hypothetical protein [Muribaculaceae bacterium]MDE6331457.1 hypothetical protein [Muribaculaceae bacterium]